MSGGGEEVMVVEGGGLWGPEVLMTHECLMSLCGSASVLISDAPPYTLCLLLIFIHSHRGSLSHTS